MIPETIDGYSVVAIGESAFENNSLLVCVVIPDTVTSIGSWSFAECTNLQTINLSNNLVTLSKEAFLNCTSLTSIHIPKSLRETYYPFDGCSALRTVTFEEGITAILDTLFGNTGLTEITIPDTVTSIGANCFAECTNLQTVNLCNNLVSLGYCAFQDCTSLTSIYIPKSLTDIDTYGWNWWYPFDGCSALRTVNFEEGITAIPTALFANTGLTEITIPNTVTSIGERSFAECTNLQKVTIPDTVTFIGANCFAECTNLQTVNMSKNLVSLGYLAFRDCTSLTSIYIPKSLTDIDTYGWNWRYPFDGCSALRTVNFEEGITAIPTALFANTGLTEITIPDTVTSIGERSFAECTNLKKITIPDSVTYIGDYSFADCTALQEIDLPDSITDMGSGTFSGCTALTKVKLPSQRQNIMESMFEGCTALKEITLPETVTTIQKSAFKNCTSLETIHWSSSLTTIAENAFENCDALTQLEIPNTVTSVGNSAFYDCDGLTTVTIPNSVTSLGTYLFYDCDALTDVSLGTGITEIPKSAFRHCDELQQLVVPYRVMTIADSSFKDSVKFTEITIPRTTTTISTTAFSYPERLTIYGVSGTYAETFAGDHNITFVDHEVNATKVTLDQTELVINKGQTAKLTMAVTPESFTDEVTWKSSSTDVATVTDTGTVKAVGVGTATIKLTVGNVSASCKVTVRQPVTSISLNKTSLTMEALDTFTLTATVRPTDAYDQSYCWSSSDETIATVDENGLVTAHAKGTAVITASALDGSNVTRTCSVTVTNTAHVATQVSEMESDHDYPVNCTDFWVYRLQGASKLTVSFDSQTEMEDGFDYLYLYDAEGNTVGTYTGTELAGKTISISGDTLKIKLVSDASGTAWGFKVTEISADGTREAGDINEDGKVDTNDLVRLMKKISENAQDTYLDINGDGKVDTNDLIRLMKYLTDNSVEIH
jgi:uncharacterized protein YjdB/Leucine-rich repeat (LRR) protein